jgi:Holliday junction DNA helicase RuvA
MITHLQGRLVEKNPTEVVIECNGVGYEVQISLNTFSKLPDQENIKLLTHLQIREDAHILYGFLTPLEREIFQMLISVSGVGTGTARTMLSSLTPEQVREAISSEDVATIQSVKGIGAKTAQRVILDLRDKILKAYDIADSVTGISNTNKEEALSALETLGFARKAAEKVCDAIVKDQPDASVEELIKLALKKL